MDLDSPLDTAKEFEGVNDAKAIELYKNLIFHDGDEEEQLVLREKAIVGLGNVYANLQKAQELAQLTRDIRKYFSLYPKAKTAKIVRTLIDMVARTSAADIQINLCLESIEWCKTEKRNFLRHRVETRLAGLYLSVGEYEKALKVLEDLLREAKKLDDKLLLVEIHIIESKTHFRLENIPKSKAALTAAKTNANAIHCPIIQQAEIDSISGILALRETDYKTAYSYFYECFEAFNSLDDKRALQGCKYIMLTKILDKDSQGVIQIVTSKSGLKYAGEKEIVALLAVAHALKDRSLKEFERALDTHKALLQSDPVIHHHTTELLDTLVEQNLLRILEPYSVIDLAHVAKTVDLPQERTTQKLSEMILDDKLNGTLDQGNGTLILFADKHVRPTYDHVLNVIKNSSQVLDSIAAAQLKVY